MPQITNTGSTMLNSLTLAFNNFVGFLPTLFGALVILVVGWIISSALARLLEKGLEKVGFERLAVRSGISGTIEKAGMNITMSHVVGELIKWMIRLMFIQAAANILGMPQVTAILNSIILFIPKVAIAIAMVIIGSFVADFVAKIVQGSLAERKVSNPALFSNLTRYAIIGFFVTAALSQLEVAPIVLNSVFIALIGTIALAVGLSFGLGGQGVASDITRKWFDRGQKMPQIVRENAKPEKRTGTEG